MVVNEPAPASGDQWPDEKARSTARTALIIGAVSGVLAIIALIVALVHVSHDFAPKDCDPTTDYMCEPNTITGTSSVEVPTVTQSPTSVEIPTTTLSPITTTTVVP